MNILTFEKKLHQSESNQMMCGQLNTSPIWTDFVPANESTDMNNEKGIQTDISMADIQSWYKFLASKKLSQLCHLCFRN